MAGKALKPIFTYSKPITKIGIEYKEINEISDIQKILGVIDKLENQISIREMSFSDIGLRTNPKDWIRSALTKFPDNGYEYMKNLLNNFTESMQTRMREETKHALAILMENKLILCHSKFGQNTITPEWKIIPRMLDIDNVLRFVSFTFSNNGKKITVKFWESSSTNSFMEWLGLTKKQAFLVGGRYRILTSVDEVNIEFQLTDEDLDGWLEHHPEFVDGEIRFAKPINELVIDEVRVGSRHYSNPEDFIQDYEAEQFGVPFYADEYERLKKNYLPLLVKILDDEDKVISIEGDDENIEVQKTTSNFHIIYADGDIELRGHYVKQLGKSISNSEELNIFHAGMKFKSHPYQIDNIKIFNEIFISQLTQTIIDYINSVDLHDITLRRIFLYVIFSLLAIDNSDQPIEYFFLTLCKTIISKLLFSPTFQKTEDYLLEYKRRDTIGTNEKTIQYYIDDIRTKLKLNSCKFYLIGVGDDGTIDPIPKNIISSDRIEIFRKGISSQLDNTQIYLYPIGDEKKLLVLLAIKE